MPGSRFPVRAFVLASAVALTAAQAQPIVPEALPDPRIPGFRYPENEATITRWVSEMTRATSAEVREGAAARVYLHGWGLWTALTAETSQFSEGQRLHVFETWVTPDDLARPAAPAVQASVRPRIDVAPTAARRSTLRPLSQLNRAEVRDEIAEPIASAAAESQIDRVVGQVKFDPTAAAHVVQQDLLKLSTLDLLLDGGAQSIPPFPATALAVKPTFQVVRARDLVNGRYYQLKVWPGPPATPQVFGPTQWPGAVWIDLFGGGLGAGAIDEHPDADGRTRTAATTYPIGALIHYRLSGADAAGLNAAKPGSDVTEGDYAILVAMHVSSREVARWTWQTFWWTPTPDDPHAPSSAAIVAARPAQLRGAARHYAMSAGYSMLSPEQPYVGGENSTPAVYAYNPWIEARIAPGDLPDSRAGFDASGQPAANNFGVQTNCMSCHAQANYNPRHLATAPRFTGARYVDLGAAEYVGTLQVDFLWSVARHAR
jgi:hypothetical protein